MRRHLSIGALLAVGLVLATSCGGKKEVADKTVASTTTTSPAAEPPPAMPGTGAPLTGLALTDPTASSRPALMVKVDNAPLGRPQAGISEADVVVEEGVEGGITRFAAIFHSVLPEAVGPVRSARTTDIFIASSLNRPLFAWSGANPDFAELVRGAPLVDLGVDAKGGAYYRDRGRPSPYNLFVSPAKLYEGVEGRPPEPMFSYKAPGSPAAGEPTTGVAMMWQANRTTKVDWRWDAGSASWLRTQDGTPHMDAGGGRISASNVVVQIVPYRDTGYVDQSRTMVPEAELIGEGEAFLFAEGKVVSGRWRKLSPDQRTEYIDASGAPFRLTPGRTWLELPAPGNVAISPG